jgi:hypothetical protein
VQFFRFAPQGDEKAFPLILAVSYRSYADLTFAARIRHSRGGRDAFPIPRTIRFSLTAPVANIG